MWNLTSELLHLIPSKSCIRGVARRGSSPFPSLVLPENDRRQSYRAPSRRHRYRTHPCWVNSVHGSKSLAFTARVRFLGNGGGLQRIFDSRTRTASIFKDGNDRLTTAWLLQQHGFVRTAAEKLSSGPYRPRVIGDRAQGVLPALSTMGHCKPFEISKHISQTQDISLIMGMERIFHGD